MTAAVRLRYLWNHPLSKSAGMRKRGYVTQSWKHSIFLSRSSSFRGDVSRCMPIRIRFFLAVVLSASAVLSACSDRQLLTRGMDNLLGTSPSPTGPAKPTESAPLVYYAGMEGLKVYSEPRASASILAQLPLHQKVYCYKFEGTYSYVKEEETGLTGWVEKARLILRLPPQPVYIPPHIRSYRDTNIGRGSLAKIAG